MVRTFTQEVPQDLRLGFAVGAAGRSMAQCHKIGLCGPDGVMQHMQQSVGQFFTRQGSTGAGTRGSRLPVTAPAMARLLDHQ